MHKHIIVASWQPTLQPACIKESCDQADVFIDELAKMRATRALMNAVNKNLPLKLHEKTLYNLCDCPTNIYVK